MRLISFALLLSALTLLTFSGCKNNDCFQERACNASPDPGNCHALFTRFFFNPETGQCEEFFWGGCEGTVPFETLIACEQACTCQDE